MRILLYIFLISFQMIAQDISWVNNTPVIRSYSSPRTTDLNADGIDDVIMGGGVDGYPTPYGVIAINGLDGTTLWTVTTRNEMFTSPQFFDYTNDNIDDVLIGGRDAELRLIDGSNGEVIWEFWDDENLNPNDDGWYNFYTPQIIEDQTEDGSPDILVANGGDHSLDFSELDRPPGHIMIIDGNTGTVFKTAVVPDSNETYLSPAICDLNGDGNYTILFGTGGENIAGNLWAADLQDLLNEDLSNAYPLITNSELGYMAPPAIGDLDDDGILDIVVQGFDGKVTALSGVDFNMFWQYEIENTESSVMPILGKFSNDDTSLDVFATIFSGGMSSYNDYYQVLLNGINGEVLWIDSLGLINFCSPIAFDSNIDGKDEVVISIINNNGEYFESELILIDFINSSEEILFGPEPGGNVACTPQITDIDNNGLLDIIFSVRADSLDPFGDGTFYENGINTMRLTTNYPLPESEIAWGSYMGSDFDSQYNSGCEGDLSLFAFPSQACPGENNAMINLYITGGVPPYTFLWSNGETTEDLDNLGPGLYSVTVIDSTGVCDVISREITEYGIISFYQSPTCPSGSDGMVYFSSTGCDCNTSFCQFIWELDGDTIAQGDGSGVSETYKYLLNIEAGTYTATIIHPDGCQIQEDILVPNPNMILDYILSNECESNGDGWIDIMVLPEDSIIQNYLWSTGETTQDIYDLSASSYSLIITDTICVDTLYFDIENLQEIEEDILGPNNIELFGYVNNTVQCGSWGFYTYGEPIPEINPFPTWDWSLSGTEGEWQNGDCVMGNWCSGPESFFNDSLSIWFVNEGTYILNMFNMSEMTTWPENCEASGDNLEITVSIGDCEMISDLNEPFLPTIFTDINNDLNININQNSFPYNIELFDVSGKKIIQLKSSNSNEIISLSHFSPGIYTLKIISKNTFYSDKIIVN